MKTKFTPPALPQWQRLLEIAAQSQPNETFWLECDAILGRRLPGPQEIERLKELMRRHRIWY